MLLLIDLKYLRAGIYWNVLMKQICLFLCFGKTTLWCRQILERNLRGKKEFRLIAKEFWLIVIAEPKVRHESETHILWKLISNYLLDWKI